MDTPRTGKYCPRCQTMTFVDQTECQTCGHRFRTGGTEEAATEAEETDADTLHRTRQFTLPPRPPRAPQTAPEVLPVREPRRRRLLLVLSVSLGLALLAALAVFAYLRLTESRAAPPPPLAALPARGGHPGGAPVPAGTTGRLPPRGPGP